MRCRFRISLLVLAALILSQALFLSSCGKWNDLMNSMGFDVRDYSAESVTAEHDPNGEKAKELSGYVLMLTLDRPFLPEIDGSQDAIERCRDSLLNYMLVNNYSRYTGNIKLLDSAAEYYPYMKITDVIPSGEFEETFYRFFGGSVKISGRSGEYFMYLDKINAYTSLSVPQVKDICVDTLGLSETENTYRMRVTLTLGEVTSPAYDIVMIKREDKTVYFNSVHEAG